MNNFSRSLTCKRLISLRNVKYSTKPQNVQEKIVIPPRIERGPTDILRALSSTLKTDPTAAHYKFHDDPYLIPKSNLGKRTFAMAQEAGRKAAIWIRQQHSDLFQHSVADPPIRAFMPQPVFNEQSDVSEEILQEVIKNVQVSDAITVYQLLQSKNVEISRETKQSLLELLCFYNNEDTLNEDLIEERWFRQGNRGREGLRKTWKDGQMAEQIFKSIDPPDSASYSALIQGMAKYCQVDNAWKLYEETRQKNIPVTVEVYNSLIRVAKFLREANNLRWELVQDFLAAMSQEKVPPNLGTLNAVLESISSMLGSRQAKTYIVDTLAEFRTLGIEPSLASWYFILLSLCRERGPISGVLYDIMNVIDGKEFTIQDTRDTHFFVTAMDVCRNHLEDAALAKRVDALLHTGNNYNLIGDSYKESVYYRHFFAVMCKSEPLDEFMKFYNKLVPNIYTPEPGVMVEVIRAIELNGAIELIPRIWADMVTFDHTDRENLITMILEIMAETPPDKESELNQKFLNVAWEIWDKIESQSESKTNKICFTGQILGNILQLSIRGNSFEKGWNVMQKLLSKDDVIVGVPKIATLEEFVQQCIDNKEPRKAIMTVEYCADSGFSEAGNLARHIVSSMTLEGDYIDKLSSIVGEDVLRIAPKDEQSAAL